MSTTELSALLDQVADTRELVIRREPTFKPVRDAWRDAHDEAEDAWRTWRCAGGTDAYLAYRAAVDREDAAQDALAAAAG